MIILHLFKKVVKKKTPRNFLISFLTKSLNFYILAKHLIFGTCALNGILVYNASVAQSAERNHGKVEVSGSIPLGGCSLRGVVKEYGKWLKKQKQRLKLLHYSVPNVSAEIILLIRIVKTFRASWKKANIVPFAASISFIKRRKQNNDSSGRLVPYLGQ